MLKLNPNVKNNSKCSVNIVFFLSKPHTQSHKGCIGIGSTLLGTSAKRNATLASCNLITCMTKKYCLDD